MLRLQPWELAATIALLVYALADLIFLAAGPTPFKWTIAAALVASPAIAFYWTGRRRQLEEERLERRAARLNDARNARIASANEDAAEQDLERERRRLDRERRRAA